MNIYEANLEIFKQTSNDFFYKVITEEQPIYDLNIDDTENKDNFIIEYDNKRCFMHSIYNIDREMQEMFKDSDSLSKTYIVFGVGHGHAFEYLKKFKNNIEHIIIVEPSLQVFDRFLHYNNIKKLANTYKKVDFIVNRSSTESANALSQFISNEINTNISIIFHYSYRTLFQKYISEMNNNLTKVLNIINSNTVIGNVNTYKKIVNTMSNFKYNNIKIRKLLEAMKGKPAILVSAGPSLDKNMHFLKNAKDKAFIIAAGSAIGILDSNGITPHLLAAFTPHENEINVFNKLTNVDIPLICTDYLYKEINPYYKGEKFRIVEDNNTVSRYIYEKANINHDYVFIESTIANVVFEIISIAGCSELIFVGQDLAYTGKKYYGKGAWADMSIDGGESYLIKTTDIYGEDIFTVPSFVNIKEALELRMRMYAYTGIKFYNATEGGLNLEGAENVKLEDKLTSMEKIGDMDEIINKIIIENKGKDSEDVRKIANALKEMETELEEVFKINQERMQKVKKLIQYSRRVKDANKVLIKYNDINSYEDRLKAVPLYGNVLQHELSSNFNTYISAYKYIGQDQVKQLDAIENILIKSSSEVQKACGVLKIMLDEFFEYIDNSELSEVHDE